MGKKHIPGYILGYYIYEIIYAIFWGVMDIVIKKDLLFIYVITTVIAVSWTMYMMYRAFIKKDEHVNLLVVIANIIFLFTLASC